MFSLHLIEYIPLQQGLRQAGVVIFEYCEGISLSIFHYNKD